MKIGERDIAVAISSEGQQVLKTLNLPDSPVQWLYVQDTDDMGIWGYGHEWHVKMATILY